MWISSLPSWMRRASCSRQECVGLGTSHGADGKAEQQEEKWQSLTGRRLQHTLSSLLAEGKLKARRVGIIALYVPTTR